MMRQETPIRNHALFRLTAAGSTITSVRSSSKLAFNQTAYSRFKYGDGAIADEYALHLMQTLQEKGVLNQAEHYYLCGSAYEQVPTAAISIAESLFSLLLDQGYHVNSFKVTGQSYNQDYSQLSMMDRGRMLSNIRLSLNPGTAEKIRGKKIIVIDDIRITGLHQKAMMHLLKSAGVQEIIFGYVAILNKENGEKCPKIEWHLNHHYINDLSRLSRLMGADKFILNARICKYVLAAPKDQLIRYLKDADPKLVLDMLHMIEADGYHHDAEYVKNYLIIQRFVRKSTYSNLVPIQLLRRIQSLHLTPVVDRHTKVG